jgi:hypothetical protein
VIVRRKPERTGHASAMARACHYCLRLPHRCRNTRFARAGTCSRRLSATEGPRLSLDYRLRAARFLKITRIDGFAFEAEADSYFHLKLDDATRLHGAADMRDFEPIDIAQGPASLG